jgi:hypothetical protein
MRKTVGKSEIVLIETRFTGWGKLDSILLRHMNAHVCTTMKIIELSGCICQLQMKEPRLYALWIADALRCTHIRRGTWMTMVAWAPERLRLQVRPDGEAPWG